MGNVLKISLLSLGVLVLTAECSRAKAENTANAANVVREDMKEEDSGIQAVVKPEYGYDLSSKALFPVPENYTYPDKYRGFYLNSATIKKADTIRKYLEKAKDAHMNVVSYDMQDSVKFRPSVFAAKNIKVAYDMGFHPVARVVVKYEGFKVYPVPDGYFTEAMTLAKIAWQMGFREIQFDYIRFNDDIQIRNVPLKARYETVGGFLGRAKAELQKLGPVRVSADIFGRIPLTKDDPIGQKLEVLDGVVDIVLPMAYPSHYTWSPYLIANPYETIALTLVSSLERLKKTETVMYIQGFDMKVKNSGLTTEDYVYQQIYACEDFGGKGYLIWNAAQSYDRSFRAAKAFYENPKKARHLVKIPTDRYYPGKIQGKYGQMAKTKEAK